MASLKIYLNTKKFNQLEEAPLYIRFIHCRKATYLSTGIYLKESEWDEKNRRVKKNHPNSTRLNNVISNKIAEVESKMLDLELQQTINNPRKIKSSLKGETDLKFFQYAAEYIKNGKGKYKIATIKKLETTLEKIKEFVDNKNISFEEINTGWLKRFEAHLKKEYGNSVNTIHGNLKYIRKLFNEAIRDDMLPPEKNPFIKFQIRRAATTKEFLSEKELASLENLVLPLNSYLNHYRNMYLFSVYTGGLRISDILKLKWSNFDGEHVVVQTQKTGSVVSIKLPGKSKEILGQYKLNSSNPDSFIFPFLKNETDYTNPETLFKAISSNTSKTNSYLKVLAEKADIEKKLHFHTARHTFATLALKKGMRIEYVSKLMGHSDITTTQIYAKIMNEELDKAMEIFNW
ncbi:hypothetical protein C3K47_18820 [Solitalea longa]|uniref:Recombinase n=1 Tax=Solitalea longa TaxID=2079460 RepID=A0A2S4ZWE8_9SPHI|nr:site-specific integrase [Solitalea longa]POY34691.1 hypothetical protein C3K47_18820 [Solitalea longa]